MEPTKAQRVHFAAKGRVHRRMAELGRGHKLTVQATMLSLRLRDVADAPVHEPVSLPHLGVRQGYLPFISDRRSTTQSQGAR